MITPCKDCKDRHMACHADCDKYRAWKADLDAQRIKCRQNKGQTIEFAEYARDRERDIMRRRRYQ